MIKKTIPISHLAVDEHSSKSVNPVDIQQMLEQTLDFWKEHDRNMTRLILEDLTETKQQDND